LTDAPDAVFAAGRRVFAGTASGDLARDRAELAVDTVRPFREGLLVRFDRIPDRTEAELWRDRYLLLPIAELTPPGEDEVYIHDLVGMKVVLASGEPLGEVLEVYELPQGLVLDVKRAGGATVMLPFSADVVKGVDSAARVVEVDPPEGMLD
jgi:16S rRNA processing protein RimM